MSMKTFYLVRHTEFENPEQLFRGRLPFPLSARGLEHANRIANFFSDKDIGVIYSSAVLRCRQLSDIIAGQVQAPVIFDSRLLEVLTVVQGYSLDQYHALPNRVYEFVETLGGESMRDVQVRALDFFYEKIKQESRNAVICSHGDPLYFLYLGLAGKGLPQLVSDFDRAQYQTLGSVRPVEIRGGTALAGDIIDIG